MLHATHLAFAHPISGVALDFHAPPPDDFMRVLAWYQVSYYT
jgi:23S rRNA pseudouridine1911/1915/1917 synthase